MSSWINRNSHINKKKKFVPTYENSVRLINEIVKNNFSPDPVKDIVKFSSTELSDVNIENNDIKLDNLDINIDVLLKSKCNIYIFDRDNTMLSNNIKYHYQNSYNNIYIINNLSLIDNYNDNDTLFTISMLNSADISIIKTFKLKNMSIYVYINSIEKEFNESYQELFKQSSSCIFSSDTLHDMYTTIYEILNSDIITNIEENYNKCHIIYTIFCKNILYALDIIYDHYKDKYSELNDIIQPYAIYFPQFHEIEENNYTFYKGYTDMLNLKKAKQVYNELYTPLSGFLDFYDLKYQSYITQQQVKLAKAYGLKGFAMYYYWFSENSITSKNMLMDDVVNSFFKTNYDDFNIFFIWANESWSKNVHFNVNTNNHIITNKYSEENLKKNIDNLMLYFKHNNYKKINNKPLLFLHNPEQLSNVELDLFYILLNKECVENGFDGIEFVIYSRNDTYSKYYQTYSISPYGKCGSYITIKNNVSYVNYKNQIIEYITNNSINDTVNGVLINYDNTARLFTHDLAHKRITRFYNNDIHEFHILLNFFLNKYIHNTNNENKPISKIFLINAWNEWGEKMTLEPSNEIGFTYLNTLQSSLLHIVEKVEKNIVIYPYNNLIEQIEPYLLNILNSEFITKFNTFNTLNKNAIVTFIIPSICRPSLKNSILSLNNQSNNLWKAIVVFDGCEPNDVDYLSLLNNDKIFYFSIKKQGSTTADIHHGTAGYVRNIGMNLVGTPWIAFLDDDDTITRDYISNMIKEIEITPSADVISFKMVNNSTIIPPINYKSITPGFIGISFCLKTSIFKEGYRFKQSGIEDYILLKELESNNKKIVMSPYICYLVDGSNNINISNSERHIIN
jgi:hypothetical protein